MKKILKISGIILLVLILLIAAIPFLFGGTIKDKAKYIINQQVEANVDFKDIDISLFRSFPSASIRMQGLSVVTKAPFENDTLAYVGDLALDMAITELFKGKEDPIEVKKIDVDRALIRIHFDTLGRGNYDIAKKDTPAQPESTSGEGGDFVFDLNAYQISNSEFHYLDDATNMHLILDSLDHTGQGDFSAAVSNLDTHTTGKVSFVMDTTAYLDHNHVQLDALIEMNLQEQKYTFKENKGLINELPLIFDGFIQLVDDATVMDVHFKTPSSDFKNFFALIPNAYSKSVAGITTRGSFGVEGNVEGRLDETHIPKLDIQMQSKDAYFKYPDLPMAVENIKLDAVLKNTTGITDDTEFDLNALNFTIGQDTFYTQGKFQHLTANMLVDMIVKGTLNLANLKKAYPIDLDQELNGILTADVTTHFDMESVEKERYQNIKTQGTASVKNFTYSSPEFPNPVKIATAGLDFTTDKVSLKEMTATSGRSDISAKGTINNIMGYMFSDQLLKGNFDLNANTFAVSDFMAASPEEESDTTTESKEPEVNSTEPIKIPDFLDASVNFTADKVLYDNLTLNDTKGRMQIKDETITLKDVSTQIFDGTIGFAGDVSTKGQQPVFDMDLDISKLNIAKSFASLDMIKNMAPVAKALQGLFSSKLKLSGNLKSDLAPNLNSLTGNADASILNAKVNPEQSKLLSTLNQQASFLDLSNLDLKDITTQLSFADGKVAVKPFDFSFKGIKVTASGSHSFDQNMNYNLAFDVPAKYLGSEISSQLSKLSAQDLQNTNVAIPVGLTGTFDSPNVNVQMKQAVSALTQQIVAAQKDKVKGALKDKGKEALSGLIKKDSANGSLKNTGKSILKDVLGGKPSPTDTTKTETEKPNVKDAAKDALNNLFGKKKKKDN